MRLLVTHTPLLVLGVLATPAPAQPPGLVLEEFIFESGPFRSCHASTIEQTDSGLVAAWFGGSRESRSDVSIWVSRRGILGWSPVEEVATGIQSDGPRVACWNPVLFQPGTGPLLLFYKVGADETEWWGELKSSSDDGRSWSAARRLPDGILGPIKNKPIQLPDGTILGPSSVEFYPDPADREREIWQVHIERSEDGGETWTKTDPLGDAEGFNAIQPSILTWPDGRMQILCRSQRGGRIVEAWSEDGGVSWSSLSATDLPNPDAGTDALTLADGRALLVYNHTTHGRHRLNVAVSEDGRSWQAALALEDQPGEYSYPAVIQTRDGMVHVTYTWRRERIKHVVLDPTRFELHPIRDGVWPELRDVAGFDGRWVMDGEGDRVLWMEVSGAGTDRLDGSIVGAVGGRRQPFLDPEIDDGELRFDSERLFEASGRTARATTTVRLTGEELHGVTERDGGSFRWTGRRAEEIAERDDGTWAEQVPVALFDGGDTSAWSTHTPGHEDGWYVRDGVLHNSEDAALLVSKQEFWNFQLEVEYRVAARSNSGIGLRGRYEIQILDDHGRDASIHGNGAVYSFLQPRTNASRPPEQWQTLQITLIGREATVVLNGEKIIERSVIPGLTAIALDSKETEPGPIILQGDHGPVEFRRIVVTPLDRGSTSTRLR